METSLKRMMEVLLFDEKIVGVRLGSHSTHSDNKSHDFITDFKYPPHDAESMRYPIRSFTVLPNYDVTFYYVKTDGKGNTGGHGQEGIKHGWEANHYLAEVKMTHPIGGVSNDYIRITKLPVKLDYMVYYLRETIRVHLNKKNEQKIQYAYLASLDSEDAFLARLHDIEK
jgi:hypothetical protein